MNIYHLTESQKDLLRIIIKSDDEGQLVENGVVLIMPGNDQYMLWGCKITLDSLTDLEPLCDEDLLDKMSSGSSPKYRIKNSAHTAIANNFNKPLDQSEPRFTIGAIIGSINGGSVQAIGNALNSEIKQIVNDPQLMQSYLEEIADKLLNEVKAELSVKEYAKYQEAVESLKQQLAKEKPSESVVKKMIQSISF